MSKKSKPPLRYDEREMMERVAEVCEGLTLREQEQKFGISHESIRRYYRGLMRPGLPFIARLCLETGVSAEWVLYGSGPRLATGRVPARRPKLKQL